MKQAHEDDVRVARMRVLECHCVPLRVGDIWLNRDTTIRITGFTRKVTFPNGSSIGQPDSDGAGFLPWPLVEYMDEDGYQCFVGAPAFVFMQAVMHGTGEAWDPATEANKVREEEKRKKEKEDEKRIAMAGGGSRAGHGKGVARPYSRSR